MKYLLSVGIILIVGLGSIFFALYPSHSEYTAPVSAQSLEPKDEPVSLLFVGDIMLGRHVEFLMNTYGQEYPFQKIETLVIDPAIDSVVANLEGPYTKNHTRTPSLSTKFSFPTSTAPLLKSYNIDIVSLANNHTYDFGPDAYQFTKNTLKDADIESVGHPFAFGPEYILRKDIKGKKFVFVGFNITNPSFKFAEAQAFVQSIAREPDDTLIVLSHGGEEYKIRSNGTQQSFYRGLIDAGADLVIGHHPHVVQEVETYKGKKIFYSLGNFIFDQYFSQDVQRGLAVKATFDKATTTYEIIPLISEKSQIQISRD